MIVYVTSDITVHEGSPYLNPIDAEQPTELNPSLTVF
jgi:hypothetical protein